jgi:hypothetical protein
MAKSWRGPSFYRKFGQQRYSIDDGFFSKAVAMEQATRIRKTGLLARIVTGTAANGRKGYVVYWRRAT